MREHTLEQVNKTELPVFFFDEHKQRGDTFGERLSHAFDHVYQQGFEHVIAIGNDTPELEHQHLLQAQYRLESDLADVVIGPAGDGGTWLIGLSETAFHPEEFAHHSWTDSTLLNELLDFCRDRFSVSLLPVFNDIDKASDLTIFIKNHAESGSSLTLIFALQALLTGEDSPYDQYGEWIPSLITTEVCTLRGPPTLT